MISAVSDYPMFGCQDNDKSMKLWLLEGPFVMVKIKIDNINCIKLYSTFFWIFECRSSSSVFFQLESGRLKRTWSIFSEMVKQTSVYIDDVKRCGWIIESVFFNGPILNIRDYNWLFHQIVLDHNE